MDGLVFDMSSQSDGTPEVFTKKDWISILDNQNQNYQGNQVVIDTSQLANSNKYINYREAYLAVPMILTLTSSYTATQVALITNTPPVAGNVAYKNSTVFQPATILSDWAVGLKNWYGSIIHSFTCDYNGTTIIQQTPLIGMWNTFRLMTSLSMGDVLTQGSSIGFYPDSAQACGITSVGANGLAFSSTAIPTPTSATFNNRNAPALFDLQNGGKAVLRASGLPYNKGMFMRQACWNFDPEADMGGGGVLAENVSPYSSLQIPASLTLLYKSYVFNKQNPTITPPYVLGADVANITGLAGNGVWQAQIMGQIYLKHIHPFFESIPLLKGVFMKLTANLNQSSVNFTTLSTAPGGLIVNNNITSCVVQSPLGGVSPIMIAQVGSEVPVAAVSPLRAGGSLLTTGDYIVSLAVGNRCLNTQQTNIGAIVQQSHLIGSITLNCPAYSFNPVFESSYLSSPVKKIVYTDCYQYQVANVGGNNGLFNNLVSNGIANIKSVLVLPFFTSAANGGLVPFQSPFDPAGAGPTSPLCLLTQFNVQISGQNMIYNTERYSYEQFMNQLKGYGAVNGGQTDGLTSGLVGFAEFESEYCYYFVDCSRMLPVEQAVPKSINILGTNTSQKDVSLYIFVTYGCEVSVDVLTGSRC